jgi:hypothetical protein
MTDPAGAAEPEPAEGENAAPAAEGTARRRGATLSWLPASPAVVALVGVALPWFAPTGRGRRTNLSIPDAFCWQAGRVGYFAPLLIVIVAVSILGPRHGWYRRNAPARSLRRDGRLLIAVGVVAGAVLVLTWVLLPKSYSFSGLSWDTLVSAGYQLHRNPQPGYFLAIVAAADAIACGVVYLSAARRESGDDEPGEAGKIDDHDGTDPGR